MPPLKVVVADDSRTIRTQLIRALSPAGFEVIEAGTGTQAVEKILEHRPFTAILDINMPELDGYGVCLKLREQGPPFSEMPIILLTSLKSHALELLGEEMGIYLQKPVSREAILTAVMSFLPVSP